jgi:mono/diheme cytochrome c family protein
MLRSEGRTNDWKVWGVALALVASAFLVPTAARSQTDPGEQAFTTVCIACHTIGGGRLVGPDLSGVWERRSEEWIIDFVQGPMALVASGDADAVAIFEEFNRIPMPDNALSDDEVRAVVAYIRRTAADESGAAEPTPPVPVAAATTDQVRLGLELFQGTARLENGGPTCNSCHDVTNDAVIGGGILAIELTTVFSRLGGPGVRAILGSPPFPVMQQAYVDRPLTDEEVVALVGFLERADAEQSLHQPRDYGIKLFGAGVAGAVFLMGVYSLMWGGRKRGSVNKKIFDRQIQST